MAEPWRVMARLSDPYEHCGAPGEDRPCNAECPGLSAIRIELTHPAEGVSLSRALPVPASIIGRHGISCPYEHTQVRDSVGSAVV